MGIPFYNMNKGQDGPSLEGATDPFPTAKHLRTGDMIYILGRRAEERLCPECSHAHGVYFIQGVFNSQTLAEDSALDETYFIGPLPLNVALPHDLIEWRGLYWPLQPREGDTQAETNGIQSERIKSDQMELKHDAGHDTTDCSDPAGSTT